ncbi:MAG: Asp-tRNA(Asn)/Glu-tRNA(Gln) amidotransferase subunit GatC [candidate division WOR-3 bacterium]|jgi:aspartyl/glutamyl-tRNA(Asn/Gln) amidotransferase C subunit
MDKKLLEELARHSFIELEEEEKIKFLDQINNIFFDIERILKEVNLKDITDGDYYKKYLTLFNHDEPEKEFTTEDLLMNSKNVKNNYIILPKIIKEKE